MELIATIDAIEARRPKGDGEEKQLNLRSELAEYLRNEVAAMNIENFLVRPKRRMVERFAKSDAWAALTTEDEIELKRDVAGLPSAIPADNLEAKQFDLLMLRMQLALLRGEPGFEKMKTSVQDIARLLEEQTAIPAVAAKLSLLQEVQTALFWEDVTIVNLEAVRRGLRDLMQFIERQKRSTVIADFVDEMGEGVFIGLPGASAGVDPERIREKALVFLRKHENDPAIHKLKFNEPLTADDLSALEAIFASEGSTPEEIEAAKKESEGLGLFVRSLVGLNREAAKTALSGFIRGKNLTANQIEFINLVVNHLSSRGWIELARLYASPFTDIHPHGIDGLFDETSTLTLIAALQAVRRNAVGPLLQ